MPTTSFFVRVLSLLVALSAAFLAGQGYAHEWMAPEKAASRANPVALDESSINRGEELYLHNCAICHGEDLGGKEGREVGREVDPPNLKMRLVTHRDGDFFWKIQHGRADMPAFKDDLAEDEIWHIINYIRSQAE